MRSRIDRYLLTVVRVGVALMWIQNVDWKNPPAFGVGTRGGLDDWTRLAVDRPVLAPYAWVVEHLVLPNFTFFGWAVLIVEACLGGFLLVGLATRFWALVGVAQTLAITLSVLNAPHEWHWSYFLMVLAHLALFATAAGQYAGIDGTLKRQAGPRKPALAIGLASILSAGFFFVSGDFGFIQMGGGAALVALGLGAVACLAGWLGRRVLVAIAGGAFLAVAIAQLAYEAAGTNPLSGDGSTFSLWLGLGAALLAVAVGGRLAAWKGRP
jgi:thiosulfate dehydrogenase [quinone] large subunit